MYKPFDEIEDISGYFRIESQVELGTPSFVKLPKFPVFIHEEGLLASVEIGNLVGDTFSVRLEIAYKADEILNQLHRYVESGVNEDVAYAEIVLVDDSYRFITESSEGEKEFFDTEDLNEILEKIAL